MIRFINKIVKLLIIASQIVKSIADCEYLCNRPYFTNAGVQIKEFEQDFSSYQQENIGFGLWMMYQPYFQMKILDKREFLESIDNQGHPILEYGQFIYSITNKNSKQKILVVSQEINQNDQSIIHKVFYDFPKRKKTISFPFNITEYEGQWILFYFFCNYLEGTTTLGFYLSDLNTPITKKIISQLPEFGDTLIHQSGGLQYYINEDEKLIILNQFNGKVSCVMSAKNANFKTSMLECTNQRAYKVKCEDRIVGLIVIFLDIDIDWTSSDPYNAKYLLQGWVRLFQLRESQLETLLIRITINVDYGDDLNIGDRDLLIKYYQNNDPQLNGFEMSTYSYSFPSKGSYKTPDELKIKVLGQKYQQALLKWHYIVYHIGSTIDNYQPLFQIYLFYLDEIEQYRFPVQVQHFSGTQFYMYFGEDKYSKQVMRGETFGFEVKFYCDNFNPTFKILCHYTCLECFGPKENDCLSCPLDSFRVLSLIYNTCNCQSNYINIKLQAVCQLVDEVFPQLYVEEIPLNCDIEGYDICDKNEIQCSFGYFKHENTCIQCPNYEDIYSKIYITCLNCFFNPDNFGSNPICLISAETYHYNKENSYLITENNYQELKQYYIEIAENGQKSLQFCEGCILNKCQQGYFKKDRKCFKCSDGCSTCKNELTCIDCFKTHELTLYQTCRKTFEQNISNNFCQKLDKNGYCNYCIDNPKEYYLTIDGKTCTRCNLDNCQYCFQYIKVGDQYMTTLDIQYKTYKNNEIETILGCALCESNFYFNFNTNKCELKPSDNNCEFAIIEQNNNLKCIIGSTQNDAVQVSDCSELQYCKQCIKNYIQQNTFCIVCQDGYYPYMLQGQCLPCPEECKLCAQQYSKYKDAWKWDVKAFYKYFVNSKGEHPFENFAIPNNSVNLEFVCYSCSDGYILHKEQCFQGCAKGCQQCEIINDNPVCTKCAINQQIQLKSEDREGSCIECPDYCSACLIRNKKGIATINPYFIVRNENNFKTRLCYEQQSPIDDSYNYFMDTRLQQVSRCQNHKKCKKKVIITLIVYCDFDEYLEVAFNHPNLMPMIVHAGRFHDYSYLLNRQVYDYLQTLQASHVVFEFWFKLGNEDSCLILTSDYVAVDIMQEIFSVQQVDINFFGLQKSTPLQIIGQLKISNFTNVNFENIEFDFSYYSETRVNYAFIKLNNLNYNVFLSIKNCVFTTKTNKPFQASFESTHSYSAIIENVEIKNLKLTESKLFSFSSQNQQNQGTIIIRNLQITNSNFIKTEFFQFTVPFNNFNNQFSVENLTITNCSFKESFFLQSSSTSNYYIDIIDFRDIKIQNSIFLNSSFIKIENAKKLQINQFEANNLTLNQSSKFYFANIMTLNNSKFDKVQLYNNSKLIINQINLVLILDEKLYTSISNLQILNTEFDSIQSIITLKSLKKLELQNIQLYNNYLVGRINFNQISHNLSTIYLECEICILENIDVIRLYGLSEISIMETKNVTMRNIKLTQNSEFHPQMLHSDFNCLQGLLNFEMSFFIYFGRYQNISIHNIKILESFTFNAPLLIFKGYDLLEKVQKELISIFDSQFENNLLLIYQEFSYSSILYFDSNQYLVLEMENSHFFNNHLNEYYQNQEIISATTMVVLQKSGTFVLRNCSFIQNILTNSSDSILYVKTEQFETENTFFLKNNLLQYLDWNRNILSILDSETLFIEDIEYIFPIKSQSGNGVFKVINFIANNLQINSSFALSSGGLRLILRGQSFVIIESSSFYNTRTTLASTYQSLGGCLYIDAQSSSSLTFSLSNIQFDTLYSRTEGGGIYLIPSENQNKIHFKNLIIKNCFSIKNSFLYFQLQKFSQIVSSFFLENCQFFQNEQGFNEFLLNLDDFTKSEAESILLQNPLIYTRYGNITLENCSFVNIYSQFLIHFESAENIIIKGLKFIRSTIRKSPLIRISLKQQQTGQILLQDVEFFQNSLIQSLPKIQCLYQQSLIQLLKLECPKYLFSITKQQFNYKDNKNQLHNQFQCKLKLLDNNNTNFQFSLMEIINVEKNHFIQISGLKFENNECKDCYYGLLQVAVSGTEIERLLKINNLEMFNNICGYSGCFSFLGNTFSSPFRQDLISNRLLQYQNLSENIRYDFLIENSEFFNNTAQFGGAVLIFEAQSLILNCNFQFNTAKLGGAIYFFADSKLLILIQSKLIHNTAEIAGGLFLNNQSSMELHKLSVDLSENNSTRYGADIQEFPRSLSLIVNKDQILLEKKIINQSHSIIIEKIIVRPYKTFGQKNKLQFLTLPSGRPISSYKYYDSYSQSLIPYNLTFRIIPLNKLNDQIKGLDGHICQITPVVIDTSSNENASNIYYALSYYSTQYNKETQDFNFDDLVIYFNPNFDDNLVLRLIIECDFIQIPVYDEQPPFLIIDYIKNYQLQIDIKTFKCQLGEYLNVTSGGCVFCDSFQNQYQVSKDAQNCSYKDETKMKSIESSMIELKPNYWRAYYYSSTIEYCYHLEENCQGGWLPGDNSCILGHIGALCEQCDLYNSRGDGSFSVSQIYSCGSCDNMVANVLSIILISLWALISTFLSVSSTVQMIDEFIVGLKKKLFGIVIVIKTASTAILIKILTNYLQIIASISTFQLQMPIGLQTAFNSLSNPMEKTAYSLDCFLITLSDMDIIYFRIIWSLLMGIFYIVIFILLGLFGKLINQIKFQNSHVSTALFYIFIFTQPNLIQCLISLLSYRFISDEYWIQGNVAYRYYTDHHIQWLIGFSLPLLIFLGFFLPFVFWFGLFKNRNNLDKITVRKIWGYLYNEYKQQSYYWETIKIIQKELIIIVLVYYDDYIPIKASLVFLLLFAYSYSTQQQKPYITGELNYLDSQSTIVCAVSIILGSSIYSAQNNNLQEIVWPFYIIIALLNLLFVSKMILKVCFAYFKKLSQNIDRFKEFIKKRYSFIVKLHPSIDKLFELNSEKQSRIKQKYQKIKLLLMPQIRKLLKFKKNNLIVSSISDDRKNDIQINSGEDHQILSFSCPKCQNSLIDQSDTQWYFQTISPKMQENKNFIMQMLQKKKN